MDYVKQLFENSKVNAPKDFVAKTMKNIRLEEIKEQEKATAKIEYNFFKLGQICVAAALLMIIINISPAQKIVFGQGYDPKNMQQTSIVETVKDKWVDFIEDAKQVIDFKIFNKEK